MKQIFLIAIVWIGTLAACKKDDGAAPYAAATLELRHQVDGQNLIFDTLAYTNAAGERYSVTRLEYYLSYFRFYRNKQLLFTADTVIYVDARTVISASIGQLTTEPFDSVACYIGVDPTHNVHGKIPATAANVAMQWPVTMGGGYHFLKLEGHWQDSGQTPGYALHLGTNPFLVAAGARVSHSFGTEGKKLVVTMNLNEWFRTPAVYSLDGDGLYTMGDSVLMQKVATNGRDVLHMTSSN
jgi:hypothetical protein